MKNDFLYRIKTSLKKRRKPFLSCRKRGYAHRAVRGIGVGRPAWFDGRAAPLFEKEGESMGKGRIYEEKTEQFLAPILERNQFELVDVEYVREGSAWYLRAYIDKEGGITVDDCEAVAREMNEILDREDYVEDSYIFEVSSPGLFRPLKKERDYARNMGKRIEIHTYQKRDGNKEFTGILTSYDEDTVSIQEENGEGIVFQRADIASIRQSCDF